MGSTKKHAHVCFLFILVEESKNALFHECFCQLFVANDSGGVALVFLSKKTGTKIEIGQKYDTESDDCRQTVDCITGTELCYLYGAL
ncbi:hypothetical protein D3C80_1960720 [compost metagenome]